MSHKLIPDAKSINLRTDDLTMLSEVERSLALEQARLQLEHRSQGGMNAYLVSIELVEDDPQEIQESLVELGSLVRSLGDEPVGVTVQKRSRIVPATLIGTGKAEELRNAARELKIDYVVFDQELSPSQVRNLETIIERPILDRAGVILQIFRKNAKTREAKTQVEIAHLEYLAPRISNSWIAFERQRGGGSGGTRLKGAGETQLELDKRRIREKIASLKKELEKIQTERSTQRKLRAEEFNVVLVGYTNAGKTTLMNALTDSHLSAKDALFETLDSAVRMLKGSHNPRVLVTDTVGFIRSIPHGLVASFRSTLQEAARADLLVHVVDVSHPRYKDHIRVTDDVLKEVGAGEVDRMYVFNKMDSLKGEPRLGKILARAYKNAVCLSAQQPDDIRKLRDALVEYFSRNMLELTVPAGYDNSALLATIYAHSRVLSTEWTDDNAFFRIRVSRASARRYFSPYLSHEQKAAHGLLAEDDEEQQHPSLESNRP
ncbi:MAG: GTPase HflX [Pseudomonadota bacterium]